MANTTDLYLKLMQPQGMKFSPIDPLTNRVNTKVVIMLFPREATAVSNAIAKQLLKQDPHLVSTESYIWEEDVKYKTLEEAKKNAAMLATRQQMPTTEQQALSNARFAKVAAVSTEKAMRKTSPPVDKGLLPPDEKEMEVMKYVEVLAEFAEVDRNIVQRDELRNFAKNLEVSLKNKTAKATILEALDVRAEKLTKRIKVVMDSKNKEIEVTGAKSLEAESNLVHTGNSGSLPETTQEIPDNEKTESKLAIMEGAGAEKTEK